MSEPHPAIAVYGSTADRSFPLIMVVGREPNSHEFSPSRGVGGYDFDGTANGERRCAFWNNSYGQIANLVGQSCGSLKALCRSASASPIVYADALPVPIRNQVGNKHELRLRVSDTEIERHSDEVFSHENVVGRLGFVIFSGLDGVQHRGMPVFSRSLNTFQSRCRNREIPFVSTPFFFGSNALRLREALAPVADGIARTMRPFLTSASPHMRGEQLTLSGSSAV